MANTPEIVQRLGGKEFLAAKFNLTLKAIEMWEKRGWIPGNRHVALLLLAKQKRVRLTLEELSAQTRKAA